MSRDKNQKSPARREGEKKLNIVLDSLEELRTLPVDERTEQVTAFTDAFVQYVDENAHLPEARVSEIIESVFQILPQIDEKTAENVAEEIRRSYRSDGLESQAYDRFYDMKDAQRLLREAKTVLGYDQSEALDKLYLSYYVAQKAGLENSDLQQDILNEVDTIMRQTHDESLAKAVETVAQALSHGSSNDSPVKQYALEKLGRFQDEAARQKGRKTEEILQANAIGYKRAYDRSTQITQCADKNLHILEGYIKRTPTKGAEYLYDMIGQYQVPREKKQEAVDILHENTGRLEKRSGVTAAVKAAKTVVERTSKDPQRQEAIQTIIDPAKHETLKEQDPDLALDAYGISAKKSPKNSSAGKASTDFYKATLDHVAAQDPAKAEEIVVEESKIETGSAGSGKKKKIPNPLHPVVRETWKNLNGQKRSVERFNSASGVLDRFSGYSAGTVLKNAAIKTIVTVGPEIGETDPDTAFEGVELAKLVGSKGKFKKRIKALYNDLSDKVTNRTTPEEFLEKLRELDM